MSTSYQNITVLGDGAMATVCAMLLHDQGKHVTVWCPTGENLESILKNRVNKTYLPGYALPDDMKFTDSPEVAIEKTDFILNAIPTQYMRRVWEKFAPLVENTLPVATVSKGIENKTNMLPTQIIADLRGQDHKSPETHLAALCGPSVAAELAEKLPATIIAAGHDEAFITDVQTLFNTDWFRVYTNTDLLGVELAAALKNVIALAAGVLDGLKAGINAKSALLARGLAEITRLGVAMGAKAETFFGISGVGDLATTCFSPSGRNRSAGELLGKGYTLEETLAKIDGVVEGIPTTKSVITMQQAYNVELPITQAIHEVLFNGLKPTEAIHQLMTRAPKAENIV